MIKEKKENNWLKEHARSVTSQGGEDGIIEKILEVIPDTNKWCVEFGSWDGKNLSNTYNLLANHGFSGVCIEGHQGRFQDLLKTFGDNKKIVCVNEYVGFNPTDNLDTILSKTDIPADFDLLSIDIDGNDYHVWQAVEKYTPRVVVIEFNPTVPQSVEFVQPPDMAITQGNSLRSLVKLAQTKGYELVCVESANAFFVDKKYYELFEIADNSIESLWKDDSAVTHIFFGYDGTVFLSGYKKLPWQQIPVKASRMQILPAWARKIHGKQNKLISKLGKMYRRLLKEKA